MRVRCAILSLAALAGVTPALAITPQDFAYGIRVEATQKSPAYRVKLPLDVYQGVVSPNLADLRVFNAKNEVVPYEVRRQKSSASEPGPTSRLPMFPLQGDARAALDALRVTIQSGGTSLNLNAPNAEQAQSTVHAYLIDARGFNAPMSAIEIEWPNEAPDFAGMVDVEASDDLAAWRMVSHAAPIANLRANNERLIEKRMEFRSTKAKFWRITWVENDAPFVLSAVVAERARDVIEARRLKLAVAGEPVESRPGEFAYDLRASLPVDRINIELPQRNSVATVAVWSRTDSKEIWRSVARQGVYRIDQQRLDGADEELNNAPLRIDLDSDRYWLLRFEKPEDVGSGTPRLQVEWIPHELLFVARGEGPFVVAYGSATAKAAETRIADLVPRLAIAVARAGAQFDLGGGARREPEPTPFPWKTVVLWSVLLIGVSLLGWMALRLLRQMSRGEETP
jgi:hypothetical protein